jgi:hypothetical protein
VSAARQRRRSDLPAGARQRATARQRRYRDRLRNGSAVLRVRVADYFALVGVLMDMGWLSEHASENRQNVEEAVAAALNDLAAWGRR